MFTDWQPVELEPYTNQAWYQVQENGLVIRQINVCGEIMETLADLEYIDELLGVNIHTADEESIQATVCGILMDEKLTFKTVGVVNGVKQ